MDNICHTLVGAAVGRAGLARGSRLEAVTLMVAANLPDIDVAVFATDIPSVAFRRGWTHGVLAQAVLPLMLAGVVHLVARRQGRGTQHGFLWLAVLSYIGVFSHVGLDLLNNYGVRLLMPFSPRWFYGDTLFIIDPWMWGLLGAGVWWSRRQASTRPARLAIVTACCYVLLMVAGARLARSLVIEAWVREQGTAPLALMVGPRPVTPFTRDVIVDAGDAYATGTFRWTTAAVTFDAGRIPKNDHDPAVRAAQDDAEVAGFLVWSRFPFWTVDTTAGLVRVADMRMSALRRVAGARGFEVEVPVQGGGR
jgi:inner membrane protein